MHIARIVALVCAAALSLLSAPASAIIYGSTFDPPDFFWHRHVRRFARMSLERRVP